MAERGLQATGRENRARTPMSKGTRKLPITNEGKGVLKRAACYERRHLVTGLENIFDG